MHVQPYLFFQWRMRRGAQLLTLRLRRESRQHRPLRRLAAERARLLAAVPVTEIHESPVCFTAFVTDPEGNRFGIHQRKS